MGFQLTLPQTAMKIEYDHDETPQTYGKNHPVHFRFSHPESLEIIKPTQVLLWFMRKERRLASGASYIIVLRERSRLHRYYPCRLQMKASIVCFLLLILIYSISMHVLRRLIS